MNKCRDCKYHIPSKGLKGCFPEFDKCSNPKVPLKCHGVYIVGGEYLYTSIARRLLYEKGYRDCPVFERIGSPDRVKPAEDTTTLRFSSYVAFFGFGICVGVGIGIIGIILYQLVQLFI